MTIVFLTALGVGGATVFGAIIGFAFKHISHKFSDIVLAFAAGIMLSASILGLILPSLDFGGKLAMVITVAGVFGGAVCMNLLDKVVPHLHRIAGVPAESGVPVSDKLSKVMLFVAAIAIHNLPEGIAAGVGFGSGNMAEALTIAGAIALHNLAYAACRGQQKKSLHPGSHNRPYRGSWHFYRVFCSHHSLGHTAFCPRLCGRRHALCHKRRDDT